MKKVIVIFGVVFTLLFVFGIHSAVADIVKACVDRKKGKIRIVSGPGDCKRKEYFQTWNEQGPQGAPGSPGADGAPGAPGICESCGSSAPPVIVHDAPDSSSNFEEEIIFTLSDDVELSHFILQGDASPHIQLTEYFKPGVNNIAITHTFGVPIELLAIVVDTDGNATKNLIVIEFDAPPQCTTGETITCGECESGTSTCSGGLWGLCIGEVSTYSDPENCGACGLLCEFGEVCIDGICSP